MKLLDWNNSIITTKIKTKSYTLTWRIWTFCPQLPPASFSRARLTRPITEAAPSTDMDLPQGVDRHLQQYAVTRKVTPTSDACYTCGGSGHLSWECATMNRATATCYRCGGCGHYLFECSSRLRCTSSRKRSRGKRSAFRSLQRVRRHSPPRSARSDPRSDQRTQTGSDVATVGVRGDRGYSVQLPFEGRAPMAISSDSRGTLIASELM